MSLPILDPGDPWFASRQVADGIWCLNEPHVVQFMRANIWFLRGLETDLLVDAGNGIAPLGPALPDHNSEQLRVVATHAHADHSGGLAEFPAVMCHPSARLPLTTADPDATLAGVGYALDDLSGLIVPVPRLSGPLADAQPAGYAAAAFGPRPCKVVRTLAEGDAVDLGDRKFDVIEVPGHSPACIALYDAAHRLLISGDAIYDGGLVDGLHHSDRAVYRRSLKRLLDLPVDLALGGHGEPMTGARMRQLIRSYLDG